MGYIAINGAPVSEVRITFPLTGAWHADIYAATSDDLSGAVSIDVNGALTLSGTVQYGGVYVLTDRVRVVAGAGGWQTACSPKFYRNATLGMVLAEILRQGGESLSSTADATARAAVVPFFAVTAGTVGANVRSLMNYAPAGTSYRFLADGSFWIGPETWAAFDEDYQVVDEEPRERRADVGCLSPTLRAGQSIVDQSGVTRNINRVETSISPWTVRQRAWWQ